MPIACALLSLGIISLIKKNITGDAEKNKATYLEELELNEQIQQLEKGNTTRRDTLATWTKLLEGNSFTKINNNLRDSIETHKAKSQAIEIVGLSRGSKPKNGVSFQSSSCDLILAGTYTDIQICLLNLEARMPNLMVNKFSLSPRKNSKLLNLNISYTVWEK